MINGEWDSVHPATCHDSITYSNPREIFSQLSQIPSGRSFGSLQSSIPPLPQLRYSATTYRIIRILIYTCRTTHQKFQVNFTQRFLLNQESLFFTRLHKIQIQTISQTKMAYIVLLKTTLNEYFVISPCFAACIMRSIVPLTSPTSCFHGSSCELICPFHTSGGSTVPSIHATHPRCDP